MCDASDFAIGAVLGQRIDNKQHVIYYSSRTLNDAQLNCNTTEKKFLAVVFVLEKFCPYLLGSKTIIFTDQSALRYLMTKKDAKARLIRLILLLQEFDLETRDKKAIETVVADHLLRILNSPCNELPINEDFPDENLLTIFREPWFADIVNYLVTNQTPSHWSKNMFTDSYPKSGISFGRNCIFLSTVLTNLLGDVFLMKRLRVFYPFVTNLHAVDTLVPARLLKKCYKVGSIGPLCSKMLMNFVSVP